MSWRKRATHVAAWTAWIYFCFMFSGLWTL
jgi:hypothetical protein